MKERSGGRGRADWASALVTWPRLWHQEPVNLPVTVDMGVMYDPTTQPGSLGVTWQGQRAGARILPFFSETCISVRVGADAQFRALLASFLFCRSASPCRPRLGWTPGYQAIWDWLGFLRHRQWVTGGWWKGIPLGAFPLAYTHLSVQDTTSLPGPALSGVSKQVHSSPGSVRSHNTQPTKVCDPPPGAARTYCYHRKRDSVYFIQMQRLFLCSPFFSHVNQRSFITSAAKSEALSLRSGRLRSFSEDNRKSCYLVKIYNRCFKTRNEHKRFNISISRKTSYAGGHRVTFDGQGGMRGVYLLVKTAIYYCAMPNNKQPEGVSDLVTRMQAVAFKLEFPSRQTEHNKLSDTLLTSSPSRVLCILWEQMSCNSHLMLFN